jgi:uncharacterized phage-associated protein
MNQNQNLKDLAKQGIDGLGHSSVQAWSAGPIFPAVIAKVERYSDYVRNIYSGTLLPLADRLETQWWELTLDGVTEQYATREDAELVAITLIGDPVMRARWRDGDEQVQVAIGVVMAEYEIFHQACQRSIREGVAA